MANLARLIQPTDSDYVHYFNQLDFINGIEAYYSERRTLILRSNQVEVEYNQMQWCSILETPDNLDFNTDDRSLFVLSDPNDNHQYIVITPAQLFLLNFAIDFTEFD